MTDFPHLIDGKDIQDHKTWLLTNREMILEKLDSSAAILFRNFPIQGKQALAEYVKTLVPANSLLDYTGGTSPREKIGEGVYTSTKMPFFLKIPLHSEMAYRKRFPRKVFFFCETAPLLGGETPIVDIRKVYQAMPIAIKTKLENEGIIYFRHLKNYTKLKKFLSRFNPMIETGTWQFVFKTQDRSVVNEYCKHNDYQTEWLADGSVILKTQLPASLNQAWFNSFHFFQVHPRIWGMWITPLFKILRALSGGRDMSATTGKMNCLSSQEISAIVDVYEKNRVQFKWQEGDLLCLDNTKTAHGRNAYLGKRKILVSLAEESEF